MDEAAGPQVRFVDARLVAEAVVTNEHGWGEFRCNGGSVSVWIQE
jgi:alpha-amylase